MAAGGYKGRTVMGNVRKLTLTALLIALSMVVLMAASYAPSGRMGIVAVAGLLPAAAIISAGLHAGFFCYVGTGLLALLFLPAKECVLLYALLFGHYPMLKSLIERLRKPVLEWCCKLALFNGLLSILYFVFRMLFLSAIPEAWAQTAIIYVGGNIAFVLYDICFSQLAGWYTRRIDHLIRKSS
jgi:hypothetical protein